MIQVVHLALTPLAGAPIAISKALNLSGLVSSRFVCFDENKYGNRVFDNDLDFNANRLEALELIHKADILHLHNYIALHNNVFNINFVSLQKQGVKIIRQWHTHPSTLARYNNIEQADLYADQLPQLVVAQFQERFYPKARLVPNIVIESALIEGNSTLNERVGVQFSPTNLSSGYRQRWDTKAFPEVYHMLKQLKQKRDVAVQIDKNLPHKELLKRKALASICIDDVSTGSYHISSLESLALGKPTFSYLDARMIEVLTTFTQCESLPWCNFHYTNTLDELLHLIDSKEYRLEISKASSKWFNENWQWSIMVKHYILAYNDLLNHEDEFKKMRFSMDNLNFKNQILLCNAAWDKYWTSGRIRFWKYRFLNLVNL